MADEEQWARVHESLGEFRAVLQEVRNWMQRMCKEFDEHIGDHKQSIRVAEQAKETAKQAALQSAVQQRSNRVTFWAPIVGSTVLVAADIILRLLGH